MFWESAVLKDELVADIDNIEDRLRHQDPHDPMESILLAVEQFVFWTAFVVRKLADSYKLSDEFERTQWPVGVLPKRGDVPIDVLNWHRLDLHYDTGSQETTKLGLRELCGVLIHSFVFIPQLDESGRELQWLLFNSDRTKDRVLYRIHWATFCDVIRMLYDDDVVEFSLDRRTGKIIKRGPLALGEPPGDL